jgi:propionyl-CoA carboxylase alpha chain
VFSKILIANRGEIACRVIRTARRMGIATVAVYSEADADAVHVRMADEAFPVGPAPSAESYLVIENILRAVAETGAEAVHPGYGFLAENAAFATALGEAGVTFIGPGPAAIAAMGDKIESKRLAAAAGVNTIPGHPDVIEDGDHAVAVAAEIGFPVMIKASAGGGGKGMRIVETEDAVRGGFESARNEARASFGDGRILIEKFITQPRHIEIQVLADGHGTTLHLGERECSIQRRHQKVIEEAPSPFVDADMRAAMGAQAVRLAEAVDYRSAGTVEFVVGADKSFYFLEMNTRLQVEHPVTEMITGLDLVERMIRIAAGEPLGLTQDQLLIDGWALEARIYAEDPARGFLPSIGRLVRYLPPAIGPSVRIDSGVGEGSDVSMYYDPMIAKLVTHGATRAEATARMRAALDATVVEGVADNIGFLSSVLARPRFAEGRLTTGFIDEEYPDGFDPGVADGAVADVLIGVAASAHAVSAARAARISGRGDGGRYRPEADWVVTIGGDDHMVRAIATTDGIDIETGDRLISVRGRWTPGQPLFAGRINGTAVHVRISRLIEGYRLSHGGATVDAMVRTARAAALAARMPRKAPPDLSRTLISPMPGLVVSIAVAAGDAVKAGQALAVVDAMKMENVLRAARDGIVARVAVAEGDSLAVDQVILEFEPAPPVKP